MNHNAAVNSKFKFPSPTFSAKGNCLFCYLLNIVLVQRLFRIIFRPFKLPNIILFMLFARKISHTMFLVYIRCVFHVHISFSKTVPIRKTLRSKQDSILIFLGFSLFFCYSNSVR